MATHEPATRPLAAEDLDQSWQQALKAVARKGQRIVIEENGTPVAAVVSLRDLERLAKIDADREAGFQALERIAAAFAHETPEESERLAALALAEAREEMRAERKAREEVRRAREAKRVL